MAGLSISQVTHVSSEGEGSRQGQEEVTKERVEPWVWGVMGLRMKDPIQSGGEWTLSLTSDPSVGYTVE